MCRRTLWAFGSGFGGSVVGEVVGSRATGWVFVLFSLFPRSKVWHGEKGGRCRVTPRYDSRSGRMR